LDRAAPGLIQLITEEHRRAERSAEGTEALELAILSAACATWWPRAECCWSAPPPRGPRGMLAHVVPRWGIARLQDAEQWAASVAERAQAPGLGAAMARASCAAAEVRLARGDAQDATPALDGRPYRAGDRAQRLAIQGMVFLGSEPTAA
jgi:hypothetical protein